MKSRRDRTRPVPQTTAHNRPYTQKRLIKMSYSSLRRKVNLSIDSFDTTATHGFCPIHSLHKALKLSGCYFSSIGFISFSPEINLLIKTLFVVHLKNGMSISRNLMYVLKPRLIPRHFEYKSSSTVYILPSTIYKWVLILVRY